MLPALLDLGRYWDLHIVIFQMDPQAQNVVSLPYERQRHEVDTFSVPNRKSATSFLVSEGLLICTPGRLMPS
jgi:hypothetical protein